MRVETALWIAAIGIFIVDAISLMVPRY